MLTCLFFVFIIGPAAVQYALCFNHSHWGFKLSVVAINMTLCYLLFGIDDGSRGWDAFGWMLCAYGSICSVVESITVWLIYDIIIFIHRLKDQLELMKTIDMDNIVITDVELD